jgi:hypothetical protein
MSIAPVITKRIGKKPKKPSPKREPGSERRDVGHRWRKGESGNPGGRPAIVREIRDLAQAEGYNCIQTLIMIRDNPEFPPITRLAACNSLLDRGFGRPMTSVAIAQLPPTPTEHVTPAMTAQEAGELYERTLRRGHYDDSGALGGPQAIEGPIIDAVANKDEEPPSS